MRALIACACFAALLTGCPDEKDPSFTLGDTGISLDIQGDGGGGNDGVTTDEGTPDSGPGDAVIVPDVAGDTPSPDVASDTEADVGVADADAVAADADVAADAAGDGSAGDGSDGDGGDIPQSDGGGGDASTVDAVPDGGADAAPDGTNDGGTTDAGTTDGGTTDAGTMDGGLADGTADAAPDVAQDVGVDTGPDAPPTQCTDPSDCTGVTPGPCEEVFCNAGTCDTQPVADGTSCDDGDSCTSGDQCTGGTCGGTAPQCGVNGYVCPVADAGSGDAIDADGSFTLDGSGSSGGASFLWAGVQNAPPLSGATTDTASGTGTSCGVWVYTLTVTDACGLSDTDTVSIDVAANGNKVSNTTCTGELQCGTVAFPWCTVQGGIDNSADPVIQIAGVASDPYVENPVLADGTVLVGGHEPTFVSPADADPFTNGTVIETTNDTGLQMTAGVTGEVLNVQVVMTGAGAVGVSPDRGAITLAASAEALLENVYVTYDLPNPLLGLGAGVNVLGTGSGSLEIISSTIESANSATGASIGVVIQDGGGPVTLIDVDVNAGNGATLTGGVIHNGNGFLDVTGGTVQGGDGAGLSFGFRVGQGAGGCGGAVFSGVTVQGGTGDDAVGIRALDCGIVQVGGASQVFGQGGTGPGTATAIYGTGIGELVVIGSTVRGSDPASGSGLIEAFGVQADQSASGNGSFVWISDSDVEGGAVGLVRVAASIEGLFSLVDSGSTIAGSRTPGGLTTVGLILVGGGHTIQGNAFIGGGNPVSSSTQYAAAGISMSGEGTMTIDGNTVITGCDLPPSNQNPNPVCTGPGIDANTSFAAGVLINGGDGHVITNNADITGGAHAGNGALATHVGISVARGPSSGGPPPIIGVDISDNGFVAGCNDPVEPPDSAIGIFGRDVDYTISANNAVFGGYGLTAAAGLYMDPRQGFSFQSNQLEATDTWFGAGAGTFTWGMRVHGTNAELRRNTMDGCGIAPSDPGPPGACLGVSESVGLDLQDNPSQIAANNYVFGAFGATAVACRVFFGGINGIGNAGSAFVYNLCLAQGSGGAAGNLSTATGIQMAHQGFTANNFRVQNNIFSAGNVALQRFGAAHAANPFPIRFSTNVFVPDSGVSGNGVAYYRLLDGTESDTTAAINSLDQPLAQRIYDNNVVTAPNFLAPTPSAPLPAGYHLDASCALADLGDEVPFLEDADYDNEDRDTGTAVSPPAPEPGPDECVP